MKFIACYLKETVGILERLDRASILRAVDILARMREAGGRLFLLGVGGGAANASHAVNDFRKLAGMEAYAPTDNVSELTARVNDEGWDSIFESWLRTSRLRSGDVVMVFSVGGGRADKNVSVNIVAALRCAKSAGARIIGVVGRDGGFTAIAADACILIPAAGPERVTAHTESLQSVIWHLLVSHPRLKTDSPKWESLESGKSAGKTGGKRSKHAKHAALLRKKRPGNRL